MDTVSRKRRSANMARIRSKDTSPELLVRKAVHSMGYRFRLHSKQLPGKPDLVFTSRRRVIFVHGCFWHQHPKEECLDSRRPKSNIGYWHAKLERNVERDAVNIASLRKLGWRVLLIWDCETRDRKKLERRIAHFLGPRGIHKRTG